ncbi:non-specific lipid-transfer protein [Nilaparvata lugens]|uniref:non-specific lipid-transfer protein n=1 Tax=Nilaparvata lugens TaxID=108931 RepID=UPI00193D19B1|nr:non-specific lipid-transfer protein [Nilaparvata lugens]
MESKPRVFVVGVGMTKFEKPGRRDDFDYPQMAQEAVVKALEDAKLPIGSVEQACIGYVYGDSTCGQRAIYQLGMNGIPMYNVNNNCATGSTALILAKQLVETGNSHCVLALGFEKMERGSLMSKVLNTFSEMLEVFEKIALVCVIDLIICLLCFVNRYSQFRHEYTLEEIMNSPHVFGPLTKLQCCPTSDGAAAAIIASEQFVIANNLQHKAVEILGIEMSTDLPSTFNERSCIKIVGYDMTKNAAEKLYKKTNTKPIEVDVIELHDCFSANELITYEALGLCSPGTAKDFIDAGQNTYGGRHVINPSGGLISKGHPLGATGIAQCAELCWQLRGEAGNRQVPNAKLALQHNIGLGGAVVVALYRLYRPRPTTSSSISKTLLSSGPNPDIFKASVLFKALKGAMEEDSDNLIERVRGIYCFKVKNGPNGAEGMWIINAKTGKGSVEFNGKDKPDVTFIMNDEDVVDLISGKMNPQKAFFQGKIKIQGNMGLAIKLTELQKKASKRIEELRSKL